MITKEERETLYLLWESEDPDDNEWRNHLNDEQSAMVRLWDLTYQEGLSRMAENWKLSRAKKEAAAS